jgi:hypothetical protein
MIYKKHFENISNLIKNLAPHQLIELKHNDQIEGKEAINNTLQNMINIIQSWEIPKSNEKSLQKVNEMINAKKLMIE